MNCALMLSDVINREDFPHMCIDGGCHVCVFRTQLNFSLNIVYIVHLSQQSVFISVTVNRGGMYKYICSRGCTSLF